MPVQAPASASVVLCAAVGGFDTGVSGGLVAGGAGRLGENAAACRVNAAACHVNIGKAAARSSVGGAAV